MLCKKSSGAAICQSALLGFLAIVVNYIASVAETSRSLLWQRWSFKNYVDQKGWSTKCYFVTTFRVKDVKIMQVRRKHLESEWATGK